MAEASGSCPDRLARPHRAPSGWWYAFTRDMRRERGFTIDDMTVAAYSSQAESAASIPKT